MTACFYNLLVVVTVSSGGNKELEDILFDGTISPMLSQATY